MKTVRVGEISAYLVGSLQGAVTKNSIPPIF